MHVAAQSTVMVVISRVHAWFYAGTLVGLPTPSRRMPPAHAAGVCRRWLVRLDAARGLFHVYVVGEFAPRSTHTTFASPLDAHLRNGAPSASRTELVSALPDAPSLVSLFEATARAGSTLRRDAAENLPSR